MKQPTPYALQRATVKTSDLDLLADILTDIRCAIRDGLNEYATACAVDAETLLKKLRGIQE